MSELAVALVGAVGGGGLVALVNGLLSYRRQGQTVEIQASDGATKKLVAVIDGQAKLIHDLQERVAALEARVKELERERDEALAQVLRWSGGHD